VVLAWQRPGRQDLWRRAPVIKHQPLFLPESFSFSSSSLSGLFSPHFVQPHESTYSTVETCI
jgi:hypothetical protein